MASTIDLKNIFIKMFLTVALFGISYYHCFGQIKIDEKKNHYENNKSLIGISFGYDY